MSNKPTNVTRLERDLCKAGVTTGEGYSLPLHPDAHDEGHLYYAEVLTISINGVAVDFFDRYSEKAVRMCVHMSPTKLVEVAKTLVERESRRIVGVEAIIPVGTAVAVCETLGRLPRDDESS